MVELVSWAPGSLKVHILFASFGFMILVGRVARAVDYLSPASINGLRQFSFNVALPAMFVLNMWRAQLSQELVSSIPYVMLLHIVWAFLAPLVHGPWQDKRRRAWLVLTAQGCFLGYVYPFAISMSPEAAGAMMTASLVYDIAGNMWMVLVWQHFSVSRLLRGAGAEEQRPAKGNLPPCDDEVCQTPSTPVVYKDMLPEPEYTLKRSSSFSGDLRTTEVVKRHLKAHAMRVEELDAAINAWLQPIVDGSPLKSTFCEGVSPGMAGGTASEEHSAAAFAQCGLLAGAFRGAFAAIARPIPAAAIAGLLLNVSGVPLHPWAEGLLETYSLVFTPAVFAIMGCFLKLERDQLSRDVFLAIAGRATIQCFMTMLLVALPIAELTRFAWMLSVWSPMTSYVMVLTFEFGFDEARSVTASVLSQILSFIAMMTITIVAVPDGVL